MSAIRFNINHIVRVKITDEGKRLWRNREEAFEGTFGSAGIKARPLPSEDAEGWSEWQLWELMQVFGPHLYLAGQPPFETTIEFVQPAESA